MSVSHEFMHVCVAKVNPKEIFGYLDAEKAARPHPASGIRAFITFCCGSRRWRRRGISALSRKWMWTDKVKPLNLRDGAALAGLFKIKPFFHGGVLKRSLCCSWDWEAVINRSKEAHTHTLRYTQTLTYYNLPFCRRSPCLVSDLISVSIHRR